MNVIYRYYEQADPLRSNNSQIPFKPVSAPKADRLWASCTVGRRLYARGPFCVWAIQQRSPRGSGGGSSRKRIRLWERSCESLASSSFVRTNNTRFNSSALRHFWTGPVASRAHSASKVPGPVQHPASLPHGSAVLPNNSPVRRPPAATECLSSAEHNRLGGEGGRIDPFLTRSLKSLSVWSARRRGGAARNRRPDHSQQTRNASLKTRS